MSTIEPHEHEERIVWNTILAIFPDAIMSMNEESGTLMIDTNMVYGGKNGEILDGRFNVKNARRARP